MARTIYLVAGFLALALGAIGAVLPLLPTVPFAILAAFCFARSSPRLERRLLEHPVLGPHIRRWREHGAVSRRGKIAALVAFAASAVIGLVTLAWPWMLIPAGVAVVGGTWIWRRPEA